MGYNRPSSFSKNKADLALGLGGGSPMDGTKVIAILTENELPASDKI